MNLSCETCRIRTKRILWVLSPYHIAYVCISAFTGRVERRSPVGGGVRRWPVTPTSPHTGRRDSPLSCRSCRPTGRVSSQGVQHRQIGWSYWVMLCGLGFRLYITVQRAQSTEHDLSGSKFTNLLWLSTVGLFLANPFWIWISMWHAKRNYCFQTIYSIWWSFKPVIECGREETGRCDFISIYDQNCSKCRALERSIVSIPVVIAKELYQHGTCQNREDMTDWYELIEIMAGVQALNRIIMKLF